jgi:diguanylate cyclase (GGDEF)-like protein/PAS domain S-box-containing protein
MTHQAPSPQEQTLWFQALLEEIALAAVLLDETGRVLCCNRHLLDLLGCPQEALAGRDWIACCGPARPPAESAQSAAPARQRGELPARDGTRRLIEWDSAPCRDRQGQIIGTLLIGRDITEQHRAEAALLEREERLRLVIEGGELGFWDWNLETGEVARNPQWAEMLGQSPAETSLSITQWNELVHPDDKQTAWQSIMEHLLGKTPRHQIDYRLRTQGGQYKWVLDRAKVVKRGPNGRALRMCGTHTDINARRQKEVRDQTRNRVLELLAEGAPLSTVLEAIVREMEAESPGLLCSILLLDEDGKRLSTGAAPSLPAFYNEAVNGLPIGPGVGSCGNAAFTGLRTIVEDIQSHPYWAPFKGIAARAGLASCWSEPICDADGKVLGTFAIYQRQGQTLQALDPQLVENAAHLARIAIERKRIDDELQLAALVYQNSSEAMMVVDADSRIIGINPAFTQMTGYAEEEALGKPPSFLSSGRQGKAFYKAMWGAINRTGHWQGEIWNRRKNGEEFAEWLTINTIHNPDGTVHRRVALFSDITKKKQSDELIWRQANFDPVTRLPNRRLFRDRFEQEIKKARRAGFSLALLFIDLDRFKEVNDTLGHDCGDALLVQAARRIAGCVRKSDTVARLGGDEFTVILSGLPDSSFVERVARSINQKMAEPFPLGDEIVHISASLGVTFYPEDATELEQLLKNADQAMYCAKKEGRNRCSYFTPSMQENTRLRVSLINDLRGALVSHQFKVVFQPILDLATNRIQKAEALLRWHHPSRGLVTPRDFIPLAEETGLMAEIGDWALKESARWAKRWQTIAPGGFQVSVNNSPAQFNDANLREWLDYFRQIDLPGTSIMIEINEGLLLHLDTCISDNLLGFRDAGIEVAIDDFGTGYSALSCLSKFHIDYLKLGQIFVNNLATNPDDMALSEAIITMAHKLGLKVIAEGVETEQQKNLLATAGCDYWQGYLFSRPLPPEEFEKLLEPGL